MQFKLTYEVDDGYFGGKRPHELMLDSEDFVDMKPSEIENEIEEQVREDFLQKVNFVFKLPKGFMEAVEVSQKEADAS